MRIELYTIGIDFDGNIAESLTKIDKRAKDVAKNVSRRFEGVGRNIQKSLEKIRLPALAVSGAGVLAFKALAGSGSDLAESITAVEAIFKESSKSILDFGKNSSSSVGLSRKEFNVLAGDLRPLLAQAGLEGEKLNETLIGSVQALADFGSVKDIDVLDLIPKLSSALSGEAEPLKRLGVFTGKAALEQEALAQGITKSFSKMTEQEKVSLRLASVLKQVAFAEGDRAKNANSAAIQTQRQSAELKTLREELGLKLQPAYEKILKITGKIIDIFAGFSDETQEMIIKIGLAITALAGILFIASFVAPAFAALGVIIGGLGSAFLLLKPIILGIGTALRVVFLSNPVIAAITIISLAVWDLWKAFNGGDSVLKDLFDWFTNKFPEAAKVIIDTFKGIADAISNFFDGTQRLIRDTIDLAEGKISGKQFLFGGGGLEDLRKQQFSAPAYGSRPISSDSSQKTTNTSQVDISGNIYVNADNGEQFVESIQNVATGSILPAGVPQ